MLSFDKKISSLKPNFSDGSNIMNNQSDGVGKVNNSKDNNLTYKDDKFMYKDNNFIIDKTNISLITLETFINEKDNKNPTIKKYIIDDNNNLVDSEFTRNVELMINLYNVIQNSDVLLEFKYEVIIQILKLLSAIIETNKLDAEQLVEYKNGYNKFVVILQKYVSEKINIIANEIKTANLKIDELNKLDIAILDKLNNIK
jgi:hypothetical protein